MMTNRKVGVGSVCLGFLLAGLAAVFVCPTEGRAGDASFEDSDGQLHLNTPRWAMTLDARSGAVRRIEDRTAAGTLLRGGPNLWVIQRREAPAVEASTCKMEHRWDARKRALTLRFDHPDAAVTVLCTAADDGPSWQAEVAMKQGTMLGFGLPDRLEFDVEGLQQFVLPENLGLAFTRAFFEPGGAGFQRHRLSGAGLRRVAADGCRMRPVRDAAVGVAPGKDADGWLPQWYRREMPRWRVVANRCPTGDRHELSLVESEHGCWLAGYRLGGWGWLLRLGGRLEEGDARPQIASVIATLAVLYSKPAENGTDVPVPEPLAGTSPATRKPGPKYIGIVLPRPTGRPGSRLRPDPGRLVRELAAQSWVEKAGLQVVVLRDAEPIRKALAAPREWFAVVNTIEEGFPAESPERAESMLDAIRQYVRDGGIWWEAGGGYPFYHAIVPRRDASFQTANRDFCDFAALESKAGRWARYGVQTPEMIYAPSEAQIAAAGPDDARVGTYTHQFLAFAAPGQAVRLPLEQVVLGRPHRDVLADYARRNEFTRGLADKAKPEVVERLKRAILLKVSTRNLKETTQIARGLEFPVLFHISDYLHGGFDKQYPDHLPPNPEVGTPEDLAALVRECQAKGHLFMPYTNPTWWCTNPKGPTFERVGDAPLSRDFDGAIYPESYGLNQVQGYTTCAWHPAVRTANDVIRRQFTEEYPVAVLFQDQVGARGPRWDTNPASPNPGAYLEGIHRIARVDSQFVPLGTEDGQDRVINWETMFCGLSWPWLPNRPSRARILYEDLWPEASWRIEPLALFLAHDKVLFYHHDLGGFVRNRRDLAVTLAMGYGLSWWTHRVEPSEAERDWLERLCRVQAAVGPRCAGRRLDEFEYLAPQVIRSRWGDLEVVANLTDQPWKVDNEHLLAPEGFLVRSPDLEAGIFTRRGDATFPPAGVWLIRQKEDAGWTEWQRDAEPTP